MSHTVSGKLRKLIGSVFTWFMNIAFSLIIALCLIQFANGLKYTYYWHTDTYHKITSLDANTTCFIYYDFFSKEMSCVENKESK